MDILLSYSKIALRVLFFLIIPAITIYFRFKKKISTAFVVGIIITSVIFGYMTIASVKRDPVTKFIELINQKKYSEAKSQLQIVIQFGPKKVKEIKEKNIAYIGLYNQMKGELRIYYYNLAKKYNDKHQIKDITTCDDLKKHVEKMKFLKHAQLLTTFAESIGGKDPIKKVITAKIATGKKIRKSYTKECKDID